jgi:hypothetical protein
MGQRVYNIVKAPIGWSLFRDRQRLGCHVSAEAALEAATQAGAVDVRQGHSIQINVRRPEELKEIEAETTWPARWSRLVK